MSMLSAHDKSHHRDKSTSRSHRSSRNTTFQSSTQSLSLDTTSLHSGRPCDSDDLSRPSYLEQVNGGGSDSSSSSAGESIFSNLRNMSYSGHAPNILTPLTNESSPPDKMLSPRSAKRSFDEMHIDGSQSPYRAAASTSQDASALTPLQTPPEPTSLEPVRCARPGPGEVKGWKIAFDPETAPGIDPKDRKKYKAKYNSFGDKYDAQPPGDPRLLFPDYPISAYQNDPRPNKARLRIAPYKLKPYSWDPRTSVGRGPATKVVVLGFDPLVTVESKIRAMLGQFGDVAEVTNMTDPNTGAFLGICSVAFKDKIPSRTGESRPIKAIEAARRAEKEGSGQRIDQTTVKIERDPEGLRCKRHVDKAVSERQAALAKESRIDAPKRPHAIVTPVPIAASTPPPNAPKGPAPKPPPQGPRNIFQTIRPPQHVLVENEPILPKIKRRPYVFIAQGYVPVLGTTIKHLQNRMKAYDWREVRCDATGYYIIFDDSKRGEDETVRCFKECNMQPLFTYFMNMECQQYGNPDYARSPTPERAAAEEAARDERRTIKVEDELDFEAEKRERAENLDPSKAALERLAPELRDIILSDIKAKLAGPALFAFLDPSRHVERRKRLGIADPATQRPFSLARTDDINSQDSRSGYTGGYRKSFNRFDRDRNNRIKREEKRPVNVFADERRRKIVPRRPIQPLHRRLHDFYESGDDSDDERQTTVTRGSDGGDSRAISEAARSPARFDVDEDGHLTPHTKRRRADVGWGAESDDETLDIIARKTLGHLIEKEPEDMAMAELEQILSTLPRFSRLHKRALTEVKLRRKALADDELFFPDQHDVSTPSGVDAMDLETDSMDHATATPEPSEVKTKATRKKAPAKPKPKRKLKHEEQEEAKAVLDEYIEKAEAEATPVPASAEKTEVREDWAEVEWGITPGESRPTVEDDWSIIDDTDGWQHVTKDNEDIKFLRLALKNIKLANVGPDVDYWALNEKEIKALNSGGKHGISQDKIEIPGYYVPNASGCARTEPYKKISQTEKSKYLAHRIKVQKAREEREEKAAKDPKAAAEAAAQVAASRSAAAANQVTGYASIRANRVKNRRLANDINTSKQALGISADVESFNQLKKRKKNVLFKRSDIHGWGLYADEDITMQDMIIEYVGEKVRQRVADLREEIYDKQGIGSSYLFRIDEDTVIDATKKGGIARFINHSCMPNCTAKIIKVEGTKRIVIYAMKEIHKGDELTYDYKFEREMDSTDRIPCLCNTVACKGFLN